MNKKLGTIPILILAAGSSSRMGRSKQLLPIDGKPLLSKIAEAALAACIGEVVVVLGAYENEHRKILKNYPIEIISNPLWENGMGSSIKSGLKFIKQNNFDCQAVIIAVCDQPHLSHIHFTALANGYLRTKKPIVASVYKNTLGVPILFAQSMFNDLLEIKDSEGAKKLVQQHSDQVHPVPFPLGAVDLDTMGDYNTFNQ